MRLGRRLCYRTGMRILQFRLQYIVTGDIVLPEHSCFLQDLFKQVIILTQERLYSYMFVHMFILFCLGSAEKCE